MNYDTIIVEMLSRIQALEERVNVLEAERDGLRPADEEEAPRVSMADIRGYIQEKKQEARERGEKALVMVSREIHGALRLKSRYPMVCNAMRQSMEEGDETLFSPESGFSSTLKIKYYL